MTDPIDKLIQDKVKECERIKGPSDYLDDTAIYELMKKYGEQCFDDGFRKGQREEQRKSRHTPYTGDWADQSDGR